MNPPFLCKEDCLLRNLYICKKEYLITNYEKIAILVDQVAESQDPHKIIQLSNAQEAQTVKLQETNKLLLCLETGCNHCYPETGTNYESGIEGSEGDGEDEDEEEEQGESFSGSDFATNEEETEYPSSEYSEI